MREEFLQERDTALPPNETVEKPITQSGVRPVECERVPEAV